MGRTLFIWFVTNIQQRKVKIYVTCFTNFKRMTNLIITPSFAVGFYSSTLFLVFRVSIKVWNGNFSFKSQKLVFKERKHKWPFFSIFSAYLTVSYVKTNHFTTKKYFLEFSSLFENLRKLSQMLCFLEISFGSFGNFILEVFAYSKKSVLNI